MIRILKKTIFLFFFILFFFKIFTGYGIIDGDFLDAYVPTFFLLKNSFHSFKFPIYEKSFGLGFPIYKDIQSGIFYPLNWLVMLPFDFMFMVHIIILLNVLILFFGIYKLLKRLKIENDFSLLLSLIFTFSSFTISHIPHYTIIASLTVLPYVLISLIDFFEKQNKKSFILTVILFLLQLAAGHPQIFFYTLLLSFFIFLIRYRNFKNFLYLFILLFFSFFVSLFIIIPTFEVFKFSYRMDLNYNTIPVKYLILTLFPDLFGGVSTIFKRAYDGLSNINETSFYFSLLFFFSLSFSIYDIFVNGNLKSLKKYLLPLFFLSISFLDFIYLKIFLTPYRALSISIGIFLLLFLPEMLKKMEKKFLLFSILFFTFLLLFILLRSFSFRRYMITILFFICYILFFHFVWLKEDYGKDFKILFLSVIILLDLFVLTGNILKFEKMEKIKNVPYDELSGKYILTFIPEDILFYNEYIKEYFDVYDLEVLKKYSTYGNRGIYYSSYSFNLYQNFTFKKYVEFFDDPSIMTGGFSNLNFILNPLYLDYDYVFVPDVPIILKVKDFLRIDFKTGFRDTLLIFYDGDFDGFEPLPIKEPYLKDIKDLKSSIIYVEKDLRFFGKGKIYMIKKLNTGKILHFPYIFENSGFETLSKDPFYLFKKNGERKNKNYITNPVDGSFVDEKRLKFIPYDLLMGFLVSIISFIVLLYYSKKEFG